MSTFVKLPNNKPSPKLHIHSVPKTVMSFARLREALSRVNPRSTFRALWALTWVTALELLLDRVLYFVLLGAFVLLGLSVLATHLSVIHPERILLDFGLLSVELSGAMIALILSPLLLHRELERKTLYTALSRPISRLTYLLGRFAGIKVILFLNALLQSLMLITIITTMGPQEGELNSILLLALVLQTLQALCLASLGVFLSTLFAPLVSSLMAFGIWLCGLSHSQFTWIQQTTQDSLLKSALRIADLLIPHFEVAHLGFNVTYGLSISITEALSRVGYLVGLNVFFLGSAAWVFQKKAL